MAQPFEELIGMSRSQMNLDMRFKFFSSKNFALQSRKLPSADHVKDDNFYELQPADYYNLISNRTEPRYCHLHSGG
ncbi:uncharacterized protein [Zea mays]|uniref:uncharacterized protein n=1 Tax=Zea mays TaxID=4577 RepID=UPI0004DE8471|nr:uncharacterized protein LOC100383456 [Zea mays]|eukprot:XP_008660383.1 uncharacterized protein LOC100383456 [Zea mays]